MGLQLNAWRSMKYDPHVHIDPEAWQALDEGHRMELVREYHRRRRIRLPNERMHAVIHATVENQVAMGDDFPAQAVLLRLMREGLDRHQAVHAIGSVLAEALFATLKTKANPTDMNAKYRERLNRLTARGWRKSGVRQPIEHG
jgi:hypothetical protein